MNNEDLSALVDGEIAPDTCTDLVDALLADAGARRAWGRYHLIGSALRAVGDADVRQAPAAVTPPAARRSLRAPLSGLALAASVAVLAVALTVGDRQRGAGDVLEVAERTQPEAPADAALAAPTPVSAPDEQAEQGLLQAATHDQRLNGYLVNFNEQRARLGMPGVHPYVRIVGFEAR